MVAQMQAQIYNADQRGCIESEIFRRFSIFSFDDYQEKSRNPFGALVAFNEETLGGGNKIFRHIEANADIIFIPLVGAIVYKDSMGNEDIIGTEQIRIFSAQKGMSYQIINPNGEELASYLQIWLSPDKPFFAAQSHQQDFNFSKKNELVPIFEGHISETEIIKSNTSADGFVGIFDGRKEGQFLLKNPKHGIFAFVINGAFEFENRLIERGDGLALSGIDKVEFEALSENAIVLVMEIPSIINTKTNS